MAALKRPKVFVGSASEGILYPGDKVMSINYQDASKMTHLQAQNVMRTAGTSVKLDVVRPGLQHHRGSFESQGSDNTDSIGHKAGSQPYRTMPLTLPGAKSHIAAKLNDINTTSTKKVIVPIAAIRPGLSASNRSFDSSPLNANRNMCKTNQAAKTVVDAINNKQQPFRTTPLVSPTPRTINEVHSAISANNASAGGAGPRSTTPQQLWPNAVKPLPTSSTPWCSSQHNDTTSSGQNIGTSSPVSNCSGGGGSGTHNQVRQVNIGGTPKQIVSNQFNSPMGMYSDDAIAEAAMSNQFAVGDQGMEQSPPHPGFVQSSRPHLPTPKDGTFTRAQPSETFKIVLEAEMDKAKGQSGVKSHEFSKQSVHPDRSSSSMSNRSNVDPVLMDSSINQSASFKKVMYSVMSDTDL